MEVCGGHTHSIYKYGIDDLLPANVELVHGPGLPGLRDPDGPRRRRDRDRPRARRDLHVLRRHDARARLATARCWRPRRAAPTCGWSTRRSTRCGSPSRARARGRLLRDRLRDDRAVDGADAQAREGRGRAELLLLLQPRDDRAAAARAARLARPAARRLRRPRPRVDRRRRAAVRVHPGRLRQAGRRLGLRARRHPAVGPDDPAPAARGALRGREPVQARRPLRGQPARAGGHGRGLRAAPALRVARPGLHLPERPAALATPTPTSTPSCATRCPACASPTRRRASAARCSRASSSPRSARSSAPRARPSARSARAWSSREGACAAYYNYGRFAREREVV